MTEFIQANMLATINSGASELLGKLCLVMKVVYSSIRPNQSWHLLNITGQHTFVYNHRKYHKWVYNY